MSVLLNFEMSLFLLSHLWYRRAVFQNGGKRNKHTGHIFITSFGGVSFDAQHPLQCENTLRQVYLFQEYLSRTLV